jgi:hypothetical protein
MKWVEQKDLNMVGKLVQKLGNKMVEKLEILSVDKKEKPLVKLMDLSKDIHLVVNLVHKKAVLLVFW